ncbi:MAG: DUF1036 domain-containing protein [Alphaproteobacteria bacterium]|nr:DUF1036 domain-containing protein [Alphaproteobacteria bacterium]MBV9419366.1 DUF1036 domain-containing protein [Alphaproteobacteria bacterium]MBV9539998.1 DUF1036 domain-containing protein [Alphaproteobacteria bacterium]MBV9905340.1 DUF1036 domain-containing protein [Alphaproteobacteria bacterium]
MLTKTTFAAVAALGLAGLAAFSTATPAQAASMITLRACNHTDDTVLVASSFIPPGKHDWLNKGWTRVGAGDCQDIFKTTNKTFYARAEVKGDSDQYWGKDIKQCVEYPGPYNFYTASEDTTCPEGEPADFTTFHSDGRPVYVWNLNP